MPICCGRIKHAGPTSPSPLCRLPAMLHTHSESCGLTIRAELAGFLEKPKTPQECEMVRTDPAWIDARGLASRGRDLLASMGIYLFNLKVLIEVLTKTDYHDFGKEVFPASMRSRKVFMHLFDGYWEDIGTIKSFFQCNIDLAKTKPPFELCSPTAPIYTRARFLPPSIINGATIHESLISDGCVIEPGAVIENSVIGLRTHIRRNVVIRNSVLFGNDEYETPVPGSSQIPLGIGAGTVIERAIIETNCRIGSDVQIKNTGKVETSPETAEYMTVDGIPVLLRGATLPNGWRSNKPATRRVLSARHPASDCLSRRRKLQRVEYPACCNRRLADRLELVGVFMGAGAGCGVPGEIVSPSIGALPSSIGPSIGPAEPQPQPSPPMQPHSTTGPQ